MGNELVVLWLILFLRNFDLIIMYENQSFLCCFCYYWRIVIMNSKNHPHKWWGSVHVFNKCPTLLSSLIFSKNDVWMQGAL
jgi:hypothetical protein